MQMYVFCVAVYYYYRNNINYTPLHLVNEDSDEILDLLDPDHLLPRMNDPVLQKDIIEVGAYSYGTLSPDVHLILYVCSALATSVC